MKRKCWLPQRVCVRGNTPPCRLARKRNDDRVTADRTTLSQTPASSASSRQPPARRKRKATQEKPKEEEDEEDVDEEGDAPTTKQGRFPTSPTRQYAKSCQRSVNIAGSVIAISKGAKFVHFRKAAAQTAPYVLSPIDTIQHLILLFVMALLGPTHREVRRGLARLGGGSGSDVRQYSGGLYSARCWWLAHDGWLKIGQKGIDSSAPCDWWATA